MEYEDSLCFLDAECDTIWTNGYLYKKEFYPQERWFKPAPDISHMRDETWLYDDIPY